MTQVHPDSAIPSDPDYGAQFDTVEAQYAALAKNAQPVAAAPADEDLKFNAAHLRNVARLVGLGSAVPQDDATLDGARGSVLGMIAGKLRAAAPAAPVEQSPDPVVEANRQLLLERSRVGVEKYRTTLAASGLTDKQLLQHALEEVLDLANYIQAILSKPE